MTAAAYLVSLAALVGLPAPPGAAGGVEGTVRYMIAVGEDRVWITEMLELRPTGPQAATLPAGARRLAPPAGAGDGTRGGLRVGAGPFVEVDLADGAVELPAEVPPDGISAALNYSLLAPDESLEYARRYAVPIVDAHVIATASLPRMSVALSGAPPGQRMSSLQGTSWTATARRTATLEVGTPLTVRISGLPVYRLPIYAKVALGLAAAIVLGGAAVAFRSRRRG